MDDLKEFKQKKRAKVISADLQEVVKIMNLSLNALGHYSKYVNVMECISVIQNSKTLIEIHLNKFKKIVEDGKTN